MAATGACQVMELQITVGRTSRDESRRTLSDPLPGQPRRVYVGRPTALGNPFQIGRDGSRETVVAMYRAWLWNRLREPGSAQRLAMEDLLREAEKGPMELLCWCAPLACHGDVIKAALEWMAKSEKRTAQML